MPCHTEQRRTRAEVREQHALHGGVDHPSNAGLITQESVNQQSLFVPAQKCENNVRFTAALMMLSPHTPFRLARMASALLTSGYINTGLNCQLTGRLSSS